MKKLEKMDAEKFRISDNEMRGIVGGSLTITYREVDTYGPDCGVSCDLVKSDSCIDWQ